MEADLQRHHDDLHMLLQQFKTELVVEQKQQLEQHFSSNSMTAKASNRSYMYASESSMDLRPSYVESETVSPRPVPSGRFAKETTLPVDSVSHRMSERSAKVSAGYCSSSQSLMAVAKPRQSARFGDLAKNRKSYVDTNGTGNEHAAVHFYEDEPPDDSEVQRQASDVSTNASTKSQAKRQISANSTPSEVSSQRNSYTAEDGSVVHKKTKKPRKSFHLPDLKKEEEDDNLHQRGPISTVVRHSAFDAWCGFFIFANAILLGIETDILARTGVTSSATENCQMVLNAWFLVELLLRMYSYRCEFWFGDDRAWNWLDMVLVLSSVLDLVLAGVDTDELQSARNARMLRALRLFRIVRTLRIVRTFKYVREFRKMVYSLGSSVQTLFWSLILVFGAMYSFALWFTQAAATWRFEHPDATDGDTLALTEYYSSFGRTTYSLFAATTNGYSWHVLVDPFIHTGHDITVVLFFAYMTLSTFGLLNIVTSVFVESAMHATRHFQDLLMDAQRKELEMYSRHLRRIFSKIDVDNGGTLSFAEMHSFLEDETTEVPQYLQALGISSSDVWVLFKLLDRDGNGTIDREEFLDGCMRLKGEATSFDINCMIFESRNMSKTHYEFMEYVEDRLNIIGESNYQLTCVATNMNSMLQKAESALQQQHQPQQHSSAPTSIREAASESVPVCGFCPESRNANTGHAIGATDGLARI